MQIICTNRDEGTHFWTVSTLTRTHTVFHTQSYRSSFWKNEKKELERQILPYICICAHLANRCGNWARLSDWQFCKVTKIVRCSLPSFRHWKSVSGLGFWRCWTIPQALHLKHSGPLDFSVKEKTTNFQQQCVKRYLIVKTLTRRTKRKKKKMITTCYLLQYLHLH